MGNVDKDKYRQHNIERNKKNTERYRRNNPKHGEKVTPQHRVRTASGRTSGEGQRNSGTGRRNSGRKSSVGTTGSNKKSMLIGILVLVVLLAAGGGIRAAVQGGTKKKQDTNTKELTEQVQVDRAGDDMSQSETTPAGSAEDGTEVVQAAVESSGAADNSGTAGSSQGEILKLGSGEITMDESTFPDEAFRNWIVENFKAQDGVIDLSQVKELNLSGREIQNIRGIEKITGLESLICDFTQLESVLDQKLACDVTAVFRCPYMKMNNQYVMDFHTMSGWNEKIKDKKLNYYLADGTPKELKLYGSSMVIPANGKQDPDCEYQLADGRYAHVLFVRASVEKQDFTNVWYCTSMEGLGWMQNCAGGMFSGSIDESKRLEEYKVKIIGDDNLGIQYAAYCQGVGWLPEVKDGEVVGKEDKRIEAVKMKLTGADADQYDLYYRVFIQDYGWLRWVKNGTETGSMGKSKRVEALQIVLIKKGEDDIDRYGKCWTDVELVK